MILIREGVSNSYRPRLNLLFWIIGYSLLYDFAGIWDNFSYYYLTRDSGNKEAFGVAVMIYTLIAIGLLGFVVLAHYIYVHCSNSNGR